MINEFDLNKDKNILYVYMIYTIVGMLITIIGIYIQTTFFI